VYICSISDHVEHLRAILLVLRNNHLITDTYKYMFCVDSAIFLGFVVNKNGVNVESKKIKAIKNGQLHKMWEKLRVSIAYQVFIEDLFLTSLIWLHHSMS